MTDRRAAGAGAGPRCAWYLGLDRCRLAQGHLGLCDFREEEGT